MKNIKIKFNSSLIIFSSFLWIISCGDLSSIQTETHDTSTAASTQSACNAQTAVIAFHDNVSQILCGCQEHAIIKTYQMSQELICTIKKNSVITFEFQNVSQLIQLKPRSASSFPLLPRIDPLAEIKIPSFAYEFTNSGTYLFENIYNTQTIGKIIVTD